MEGMYSVWAEVPLNETRVREAMGVMQEHFGGPAFEPHVTVLGAQCVTVQEAMEALDRLCHSLPPYSYRFVRLAAGHDFYQCVYLLVDPSPEVLRANTEAKLSFAKETDKSDYMPHASLMYGELSEDEKTRAKLLVAKQFPELQQAGFEVRSLCLYCTSPEDKLLKSWTKIAELPLQGHTEGESK